MLSEAERRDLLETAASPEVRASFRHLRELTERADVTFDQYLGFLTSFSECFGRSSVDREICRYQRVLL